MFSRQYRTAAVAAPPAIGNPNFVSSWPVAGGTAERDGTLYAAGGIAHYDGTYVVEVRGWRAVVHHLSEQGPVLFGTDSEAEHHG